MKPNLPEAARGTMRSPSPKGKGFLTTVPRLCFNASVFLFCFWTYIVVGFDQIVFGYPRVRLLPEHIWACFFGFNGLEQ